MSPHGVALNIIKPSQPNDKNNKSTENGGTAPVRNKPKAVQFKGVEVNEELASALERRFVKCGVPESPIAKEECSNRDINASSEGQSSVGLDHRGLGGFANVNARPAKNNQDDAKNTSTKATKSIRDTLEEASRFLQAEVGEQTIKEGSSKDSSDSKIDEELSAAEELARALDKLLEFSESADLESRVGSMEYNTADAYEDNKAIMGGVESTECVEKQQIRECDEMTAGESKLSVTECNVNHSNKCEKNVQNQSKDWNEWNLAAMDINDDNVSFPTGFECLTRSQFDAAEFSTTDHSFFPATFDEDKCLPFAPEQKVKASRVGIKKMTKACEKKQPQIKVNLKIDGAPALNVSKSNEESLFFVSQPSPSCGDNAGLLQTQHCFGLPTKVSEATSTVTLDRVRDTPKKRGVVLNSPTKKRLNNLGLKLGLIHNAVPKKDDRCREGESPSMAGLLHHISTADENVGMISVQELRDMTPKHQQSGHFFESPSSPIIYGSLAAGSPMHKNLKTYQTGFDTGKKKKASKIIQRITSPLLTRRTGRAELNDDASYGEV
jgi:hypothetical protein